MIYWRLLPVHVHTGLLLHTWFWHTQQNFLDISSRCLTAVIFFFYPLYNCKKLLKPVNRLCSDELWHIHEMKTKLYQSISHLWKANSHSSINYIQGVSLYRVGHLSHKKWRENKSVWAHSQVLFGLFSSFQIRYVVFMIVL